MSRTVRVAAIAAAVALSAGGAPAVTAQATTTSRPITIGTNKHLVVSWRGNGHGIGMSQYGALGRANAKQTYKQILGFYYRLNAATGAKTTLAKLPGAPRIRVLISNTGAALTVAAAPHLVVDGVTNALPTTGIRRYRLIANATNLTLQKLPNKTGATWQNVKTGLKSGAAFHRTDWVPVRLFFTGGTSTSYYGYLRAVRLSASQVETVNSVGYDRYVQGVVPYEMPAFWPAAALNAQAVAARTYGDWQVHQPMNANYDICDTSMCQVYGGHQQYDRYGHVTTWQDLPQPASATAGQVLRYNGGPVFAQFSASNGGWTVAGSFPYLTAKQDTYDTYKPNGSPATITVAALAQQFGLKTITEIDLVRDGNGTWGGRVVSGTIVNGTTRMPITGDQFRAAVNNAVPNVPVGSTWIQLKPTP